MKIFKKQLFIASLLSLLAFNMLIFAQNSYAGDSFLDFKEQEGLGSGQIADEFGQSAERPRDIRLIIARIVQAFLGLLAIIFTVLLVHGGYKYMMSRGNDEEVKNSKKQINQAIIGLIIILAAYSITFFLINEIRGATTGYLYSIY